ncbi:MAG TPA: tripartite tricarboxylate transporter substrate binding protein [Burkholderiales bacterium]|nr:tripartite tricarboxylate transporter substrate binding protein [Burkholderiales bacterium]
MNEQRRGRYGLTALLATICAVPLASAQSYPAKPVRMLVGFPPSGGNDVVARVVATRLSERWGQSVIVENRPGATGTLAANVVARSAGDGYTLLAGAVSTNAIAPFMYSNLPYDAEKAFAPVTLLASIPNLIAVHPSLPVKSLSELIALAKQMPGKLSFPSAGNGSTPHVAGEMFMLATSVRMLHVPYKGAGQAIPDLLAGQTSVSFDTTGTIITHVRSGRLRALAVAAPRRFPAIREVPTTAEAGLPGFEMSTWIGLFAPADTPPAIVQRLHSEIAAVLRDPALRSKLTDTIGADESTTASPEEFAAIFRKDLARYKKLVSAIGLKLD